MTSLVLASSSASRARLLRAAGVSFETKPAQIDENTVKASLLAEGADGRAVADALAELKSVRVSLSVPGAIVLGADQVLMLDGELVSKCADIGDAARLLSRMRGKRHDLISAAVLAKDGGVLWRHAGLSSLWMRSFSDEFLGDYLKAEGDEILGGVGCYRFEGLGAQLFERVEGDYFSILGLPLLPLLTALRDHGVVAR